LPSNLDFPLERKREVQAAITVRHSRYRERRRVQAQFLFFYVEKKVLRLLSQVDVEKKKKEGVLASMQLESRQRKDLISLPQTKEVCFI